MKVTYVLNETLFARPCCLAEEDVRFSRYDAVLASKAALPRLVPAGDGGDTDVYGAQQHAPLLDVHIPLNE